MGLCAKKMTGNRQLLAIGAAVLVAVPAGVSAQDTMTINADVQRSCHLGALPLMFGTVAVFFPAATAQAPIYIDCTPNTAFMVSMDDGINFNAGQRRMRRIGPGFGTFLNYDIYRNAARTQRWGSGAGQVVSGVAPADGKVTLYAYGRTQGFVAAGPFEDTVTITITF